MPGVFTLPFGAAGDAPVDAVLFEICVAELAEPAGLTDVPGRTTSDAELGRIAAFVSCKDLSGADRFVDGTGETFDLIGICCAAEEGGCPILVAAGDPSLMF